MKLSFSTLGSPFYSISQIIDMAVQNRYEGVELRTVGGTNDLASLEDFKGAGLAKTAARFQDAGLEVVCVDTGARFNAASKEQQNYNLDQAKFSAEIACVLGSSYIRVFSGPLIPTQGYGESIRWIREGYERLGETAGRFGILPLVETHDDFSTSAQMADVMDGLAAENIGVIWDILHPLRFGEAVADTYAALSNRIRHVHIKDSRVFSPQGADHVLTGEGNVPIRECVELLRNGGYQGYLSFEWEKLWHPEIPEPEIAIPHYAEVMRKLL